jgi:methyl-accepting chemotaxis protein
LTPITDAPVKVREGDLSARADLRPGDEFGGVGDMLNSAMAHEEMTVNRERVSAGDLHDKVDALFGMSTQGAGDLTVEVSRDGDDAIGKVSVNLAEFLADRRKRTAAISSNVHPAAGGGAVRGEPPRGLLERSGGIPMPQMR